MICAYEIYVTKADFWEKKLQKNKEEKRLIYEKRNTFHEKGGVGPLRLKCTYSDAVLRA